MAPAKKKTTEEDRLGTCARLYGEHPDNDVAWAQLREAAVRYARSPAGKKLLAGEQARVRPRREVATAEKKRKRQEWEAAERERQARARAERYS